MVPSHWRGTERPQDAYGAMQSSWRNASSLRYWPNNGLRRTHYWICVTLLRHNCIVNGGKRGWVW